MQRLPPVVASDWASLYGALSIFDQPYNLAPSLHVAIAIVLWAQLRSRFAGKWLLVCHIWVAAIVMSALSTWQHNLVDVLAGGALGAMSLLAIRGRAQ